MTPEEWFATSTPEPKRVPLRAGPLHLVYENGDLRDITCGPWEVLRRIYLVFQDRNWTARPWIISAERIVAGAHSFEITFHVQGTFDAEPFEGDVEISGDEEGTISYTIDGSARAPFVRNRLGLCVLHPMSAAGLPCLIEDVTGTTVETAFPSEISPNQPFVDIRAVTHEFMPGAWASTRISGETFEMEDHRNWSDASFKTYCTPISLPFPVTVQADDELWQSLTLAIDIEDVEIDPNAADDRISITLESESAPLPELGLQSVQGELTTAQVAALRELRLGHLRVDIHARDADAPTRLMESAAQARELGTRLVVALFIDEAAQVGAFAQHTDLVHTWLIFDGNAKVSGVEVAAAARLALGPEARIGGGTNLYFTELNREPPAHRLEVIAFSVNPQVHAADSHTIVQNLQAQAAIARAIPHLAGEASVHVGPVTLRPRFNPNATEPDLDASNTALPADVDARQAGGLGAAWTAMSLKYLAEPGTVDAITYFETIGWRGVMERPEGNAQPEDFASRPGQPYPLFTVLRDVAGYAWTRKSTSSAPQLVDALVVESNSGARRALIANFTESEQRVALHGFGTLSSLTLPPLSIDTYDLEGTTA